jgi:hypothetical protein
MSSETEHDVGRPTLSWEPVVRTGSPQNALGRAASVVAATPSPDQAPPDGVDPEAQPFTTALFDFGIAPISLDPLLRDQKPARAAAEPDLIAPVLGEFHLALNDLAFSVAAPKTPEPETPEPAMLEPETPEPETPEPETPENFELKIAPLDMPDLTPSGRTPTIDPVPAVDASIELPVIPAAVATDPVPTPAASASLSQIVETPAAIPPLTTEHDLAPTPGLPADVVSSDPTPTTVIPGTFAPQIAAPSLPAYQPTLARTPQVAVVSSRAAHISAPAESRKKQKKTKQSSGGGGIALFFTLLVLGGIIAGAVVFGRPYLFPDDWDLDAKPYGEAVESVRGADIVEPLLIDRQASVAYGIAMADHLLGDWEADLPMWRSLALAKGAIDPPGLRDLVANWTPAYYSPATSQIIANNDLLPGAVDGALTEAMALAAIDQETGWAAQLDPASLDTSALIEAVAIAESQSVSRQTSFGAAVQPERRTDVAAFLPPVLEYRINAPQAFVEFAESGDVDIAGTSLLPLSREPVLEATDTLTTSQQRMDRTFWYMVFAAYNSPSDAYAASNALVQSSLATVDRAGVQCTYATFSGTDVVGTPQLANVLQTWAITAPAEMAATMSVLPDGAQQLSSCDPGAGFESGARFGVAREIARWRTVELAAIENVDPQAGTAADRALAVQQVRATQAGLPMIELLFDTTYADSARVARGLVSTDDDSLETLVTEPVGTVLGE